MARDRRGHPAGSETYVHRLAWVIRPRLANDIDRWELVVDAHNGEVLIFEDTTHYATARRVTGGVYPLSNDGVGSEGVEQAGWPMPFDVVSTATGPMTADSGGNLPLCVDGTITSSLSGAFVDIADACGALSLSGTGDLDFATSTGTDCTTPGTGGAGNTHASRTAFHQLNRIREQAQGQLPANAWLQSQLTANVNLGAACNAAWSGGTVNYFCSVPASCANTGEIAGIVDHEWGHGMDDNDAIATISSPGEGVADLYAYLRTDTSCIGRGFYLGTQCGGYGDACTACDGARDIDYTLRASGLPHDVTWIDANCAAAITNGPCGGASHCEGAVYAEAVYDLISTDLPGLFGMDHNTALEVGTRLTYLGGGAVGTWFQCTAPYGGCNADGGYLNYLVADGDNGNINDGTPRMSAIFAAFDRHGIACDVPAVVDSGCAGTPATAPVVAATPLDRGASLSWGAIAGATEYQIFRTDGVSACASGKAKVGTTTGTSFIPRVGGLLLQQDRHQQLDGGLQNGRATSYIVLPIGAGDACIGPASACTTVTPTAGANLSADTSSQSLAITTGDGDDFLDNCETATLTFDVNNIGTGSLTNTRIVGVTSPSHPSIAFTTSFPAATSPSTLAECDIGTGSFELIAGGLTFGDTIELEVEITADELTASKTVSLLIERAESDYQPFVTRTFTYESDAEEWQVAQGTFDRSNAAQSTAYYLDSSSGLANHCDHVRSPLLRLSTTSTLETYTQLDIEPECPLFPFCALWADRANIGIYEPASGLRGPIDPDGGRTYNASGPFTLGSCDLDGENGWAGTDLAWTPSTWTSTALRTAIYNGRDVQLDVRYGTDPNVQLSGFHLDQVTVTDFELQTADVQTDVCAGFGSFNDADGDGIPNGADLCRGDDASGDGDGDGVCADADCDDGDDTTFFLDSCSICGGDNTSCGGAALVPDLGTVALWHLDGGGDDASGFSRHLGVKPDRVTWMPGKFGQAAAMGTDPWSGDCFSSDGGALTSPGHGVAYPGGGDWTLEAWIKAGAYDLERTVLAHYSEHWNGHEPYQLRLEPGGELRFIITDGSNQSDELAVQLSAPAGTWVNVAAIYRAGQGLEIYEDFVLVAQKASGLMPETLTQYDGYIGGTFCGTSDGLTVDEVRISDIARYRGCLIDPVTDDTDGDGTCNDFDLCPGSDDAVDTDADGTPDGCDLCPDFDDTADADSDGVPDGCDICTGDDATGDGDGDGVCDDLDLCLGDDAIGDTDSDGVCDDLDLCPGADDTADADADGVPDGCDICPGANDAVDADADGVPDGCDLCAGADDAIDADADGVPDGCDICPGADDGVDTDADGVPDGCDICEDADDNLDGDGDGVPDGCDLCAGDDATGDADGDGVCDDLDLCPGADDTADADADGVPDGCDICAGSDDHLDADADGVPDGCDICEGSDDEVDADADGVPDGCDLCPGADDRLDADGDGVPDGCDLCQGGDTDDDGVCDDLDACPGLDDSADADGDNVPDGCDLCQGDDASGDGDGDDVCADLDCNDDDPEITFPDACGVCGGDNSSCVIFSDGFESGDTSSWSQ